MAFFVCAGDGGSGAAAGEERGDAPTPRHHGDAKTSYSSPMKTGRWLTHSVRAIHRATGGAASEASLRRWGTLLEQDPEPTLPISEREAIALARTFAAASPEPLHKGIVLELGRNLQKKCPLPAGRHWIVIDNRTHVRVTTNPSDLAEWATTPLLVIPIPAE